MFGTLIDVDTDGNVFLQDKAVALLPKLFEVYKNKYMGSKMVRWIVCMDDYKSPYRKIPDSERVEFVTAMIFEKNIKKLCSDALVLEAREEYRKLQYDPDIDQYHAMTDQMYKMTKIYRDMVPSKENFAEMNDMQLQMAKSSEAREKLKQLILKNMETETKISGMTSDDFSLFEQDQRLKEGR